MSEKKLKPNRAIIQTHKNGYTILLFDNQAIESKYVAETFDKLIKILKILK